MFFNKKEAVDIRSIPKQKSGTKFVAKDGYGFVDLTKKRGLPLRAVQTSTQNPVAETKAPERSMFGFFDSNVNSSSVSSSSNSSDTDEAVRKVSMQLSDLDSKLYKLEQRIELLERKAGITGSSSSNSGFSW